MYREDFLGLIMQNEIEKLMELLNIKNYVAIYIDQLSLQELQIFLDSIAKSKIEHLNLSNKEFDKLLSEHWKIFFDFVNAPPRSNNIKYLNLSNNKLNELSQEQWGYLYMLYIPLYNLTILNILT